jgi:hypothetical protein
MPAEIIEFNHDCSDIKGTLNSQDKIGNIHHLFVSSYNRRQKIGTQLFHLFKTSCVQRNISLIILECFEKKHDRYYFLAKPWIRYR